MKLFATGSDINIVTVNTKREKKSSKASIFLCTERDNVEKIWSCTTGNSIYSIPAVANGVVYIGINNNVSALGARTGAMMWGYTTRDLVASSPSPVNGVVYVGRTPVISKVMLNPTMMTTVAHAM